MAAEVAKIRTELKANRRMELKFKPGDISDEIGVEHRRLPREELLLQNLTPSLAAACSFTFPVDRFT